MSDDSFDVSNQSIVLLAAIDMSLRPNAQTVSHYNAAAKVDRVISGLCAI